MVVRRIVANVEAEDLQSARGFHQDLLGLEPVMDHGWIITFAADGAARPQISIASEGVRRFYGRDPFGKLVNILAHAEPPTAPD
jgi:hypothetical protein